MNTLLNSTSRPGLFALAAVSGLLAAMGGSIEGTITDPSGATVPLVAVVVRNSDTGEVRRATSDGNGAYAFPGLPVGHYVLEAEHSGFKPFARTGLEVTADAPLRVDVMLAVGLHGDVVTVSETATQVETADSQIGGVLSGTKMAGLPVNGRSYTDLLALQPGVIPQSSQQPNAVVMAGCTSAPPSGDLNPGNLSVSGQRETSNGFTVNGTSAQEDFNMGAAIMPNLDSIQELHVLTSNFNAEYGNFSGGQILVTTKLGTNVMHGSVFEFLRNTSLDARNYFAAARAKYDRNQAGGTLGGAIRKDKLFFFADYQGSGTTQGMDTGLIAVPSLQNRTGDFSDIADSLTGKVNGQYWASLLSQKLGYAVAPGEAYYTAGCTSAEECVLPNARIPRSAWAAPAQALLPYIPAPNQGRSNFSTSGYNETLRDDKGAMRIDGATRWGSVSGYYFADDYRLDNPYPTAQGGANVPGFNAVSLGRAQLASAGLTSTFGASAVNELRLGYLRTANNVGKPVGGVGPTLESQGFVDGSGNPGIVALAPQIEGIENVSFNEFTIGTDITGVAQANNLFQLSDNFSKVVRKHTLRFGAGIHYDQVNINPNATYNGSFLFQGTETGSDFADFVLGIASSYTQGDSQSFYLRNRYFGLYGQDSWRARPNLTINYGLRWDLLPPWREKYNQIQTLVPGEQSVVYPGAPAGLVFPGDPGIPDTLAPARDTNFGPRIGLAYSPNSKTSVRAGYGVFYTAIEGLSAGIMSANPPYGYSYTSVAPPLFATPFITAASGQDVGQRFPEPIQAHGASARYPDPAVDWPQYLPVTGVPAFFHENTTPYTQSYTVSIEREVARDTILSASYAGAEAHHLLVLIAANPGNPALCLSLSRPEDVAPGTETCGPFGESGTYTARSGQTIQGTRGPFDADFAALTYQKTIGNSDYNALEISLRHAAPSLEVLLGYTYGKSLDESSGLPEAVNPLNPRLSRALSAFDMRHDLVASYQWKAPLAKLLGHRSAWSEGWSLSGVARFGTGLPVTLYNNNDTSLLGTIPNGINNNGVDTPNYRPGRLGVNRNPRNGRPAFDTALFSLPELGTVGTAARRFFSGPGMANCDVALHRNLRIAESRRVELRVEAFNVFNHGQFYGPASVNGNISSPSFGQIVSAAAPRLIQMAVKFQF
jgi:hypothetical protein